MDRKGGNNWCFCTILSTLSTNRLWIIRLLGVESMLIYQMEDDSRAKTRERVLNLTL